MTNATKTTKATKTAKAKAKSNRRERQALRMELYRFLSELDQEVPLLTPELARVEA
jgi:hypothetical protein